jgi:hypothetical protein
MNARRMGRMAKVNGLLAAIAVTSHLLHQCGATWGMTETRKLRSILAADVVGYTMHNLQRWVTGRATVRSAFVGIVSLHTGGMCGPQS